MPILDDERVFSGELSAQTLEYIRRMARWMRFVAFFFIVLLSGGLLFALYSFVQSFGFYSRYGISMPLVAWLGGLAPIGLLLAFLYFYGMLARSARRFAAVADQAHPERLESALRLQHRFWILVLFFLVLFVVLSLLYFLFLTSDFTRVL